LGSKSGSLQRSSTWGNQWLNKLCRDASISEMQKTTQKNSLLWTKSRKHSFMATGDAKGNAMGWSFGARGMIWRRSPTTAGRLCSPQRFTRLPTAAREKPRTGRTMPQHFASGAKRLMTVRGSQLGQHAGFSLKNSAQPFAHEQTGSFGPRQFLLVRIRPASTRARKPFLQNIREVGRNTDESDPAPPEDNANNLPSLSPQRPERRRYSLCRWCRSHLEHNPAGFRIAVNWHLLSASYEPQLRNGSFRSCLAGRRIRFSASETRNNAVFEFFNRCAAVFPFPVISWPPFICCADRPNLFLLQQEITWAPALRIFRAIVGSEIPSLRKVDFTSARKLPVRCLRRMSLQDNCSRPFPTLFPARTQTAASLRKKSCKSRHSNTYLGVDRSFAEQLLSQRNGPAFDTGQSVAIPGTNDVGSNCGWKVRASWDFSGTARVPSPITCGKLGKKRPRQRKRFGLFTPGPPPTLRYRFSGGLSPPARNISTPLWFFGWPTTLQWPPNWQPHP